MLQEVSKLLNEMGLGPVLFLVEKTCPTLEIFELTGKITYTDITYQGYKLGQEVPKRFGTYVIVSDTCSNLWHREENTMALRQFPGRVILFMTLHHQWWHLSQMHGCIAKVRITDQTYTEVPLFFITDEEIAWGKAHGCPLPVFSLTQFEKSMRSLRKGILPASVFYSTQEELEMLQARNLENVDIPEGLKRSPQPLEELFESVIFNDTQRLLQELARQFTTFMLKDLVNTALALGYSELEMSEAILFGFVKRKGDHLEFATNEFRTFVLNYKIRK